MLLVEQNSEDARFDIEGLKQDLKEYDTFKKTFMELLTELEKEIFEKQT